MKFAFVVLVVLFLMFPAVQACEEGVRRVCGSDVGVCESGRSVCRDGKWDECEGAKGPASENDECGNGLDDNCDGESDENCFPWMSFVLVGTGFLFIGIGLVYMQHGKEERMVSEGLAKD